jgi:predicted RecA/RadA family phage recombinase
MGQATSAYGDQTRIDYTPGSAVAEGDVVVQGLLVAVATQPIAASELGSLATSGVFDFVKATGAITAGAAVYWDVDGDPVGGTAGTGALTTTSSGNLLAGKAAIAAASGDATARVLLLN